MRSFLASISLRTLLLALILLRPSTARSQAADANDQQAFRDFLTQAKTNAGADPEKVTAFYRTTGAFWRALAGLLAPSRELRRCDGALSGGSGALPAPASGARS